MRRRRRLAIDSLEGRDLLSITPLINSPGWTQVAASTATTGSSTGGQGSSGSGGQLTLNPITGTYENGNLGGSGITTDVTPPRPNEVVRRNFTARFSGKVQELPPRLLDQTHQFYILAPGTSSAFLHGTAQVRYYTPNTNPIAFPDPTNPGGPPLVERATATTGTISMADRSTQSGVVILANLTGSPTDEDRLGRPTHFNLMLNGGGGSGGIYASSTGTGTLDIAYRGNRATITVHASIFISGVGNAYDILQSNTHH
jgi:hypothetical protein